MTLGLAIGTLLGATLAVAVQRYHAWRTRPRWSKPLELDWSAYSNDEMVHQLSLVMDAADRDARLPLLSTARCIIRDTDGNPLT